MLSSQTMSRGLVRGPVPLKRRAPAALTVSSLASLLHACRGRELSLQSGHGAKHQHTPISEQHTHITGVQDGVRECGGAAPGAAQAGLGTAASDL